MQIRIKKAHQTADEAEVIDVDTAAQCIAAYKKIKWGKVVKNELDEFTIDFIRAEGLDSCTISAFLERGLYLSSTCVFTREESSFLGLSKKRVTTTAGNIDLPEETVSATLELWLENRYDELIALFEARQFYTEIDRKPA